MGAILYASWPLFARAWRRGDFVGAIGDFTAPTWPVKAVILFGTAVLILQFAARIYRRYQPEDSMTPFDIGLLALAGICLLVMSGLFVPIALIFCSFVGLWAIKGSPVLAAKMLGLAANDAIQSYFFGVVPLFVLMGFIVAESGMGRDAYDVAAKVFRRLRGGLGVGTVAANAVFAAITGISIASAAVFTKIAMPEMVRHGYPARFAAGIVAGSSILGMLIPPSLLLILYGLLTEQSIGDLFLAGIGPGLLLTVIFSAGVIIMARPHWGTGEAAAADDLTGRETSDQDRADRRPDPAGAGRHLSRLSSHRSRPARWAPSARLRSACCSAACRWPGCGGSWSRPG